MSVNREQIAINVTNSLLTSIHRQLQIPNLSIDEGEVRLIDRDDTSNTIYLGLFERDSTTGETKGPAIIWSIEIYADIQGEPS